MPAPGNELNTLLAPRFLFRFAAPVKRHKPIWSQAGVVLDESFRLPDLASLDRGTPSSERRFADVRMAWAPEGLAITVTVTGKNQALWCRESRLDESDGLQVWIDTRATHNIHRASKYCHRFGFLPSGGGRGAAEAAADQLLINRARENARPVRPRELQAIGRVKEGGYHLMAFVPAQALGGYDPEQHDQLGFHYEVIDRELGVQSYANGREFPTDEDPSCWATLRLEG
ncbi:hypothetical protein KOR34_41640 [Posidoniimonas corsicana]|uniref:Carbohydrate-binding domain-containing protein n=1 Tax=Posidoniimonas corsicana TaxID=1938618 RepID=A0A5C5V1W1_9BACT|nr:hypothetical protein [Posidoniimonas corsicana]TWT32401.1 hypothetical protein KOR34_41640 [Posidoniimonas corsicana]